MPELPEVEIVVNDLRRELIGRKILDVQTDWPKYFQLPRSEAAFRMCVTGRVITAVDRRAKNVLIHLEGDHLFLVHQKLSGRLIIGNWERTKRLTGSTHSLWQPVPSATSARQPTGRFIHLVFELDDGRQLALSDLRKFAKVLCGPRDAILNLDEIRRLGPEPLDPKFAFSDFERLFEGRTGRIKPLLMNPNFIAGIGNIYSDEILYAAGVHPLSQIDQLPKPRLRSLYRSMRAVLRKSIRLRGTGIEGSRDSPAGYDRVRMVYQQELCPNAHAVHRIKASGRSATFAPGAKAVPPCQHVVCLAASGGLFAGTSARRAGAIDNPAPGHDRSTAGAVERMLFRGGDFVSHKDPLFPHSQI